MSNGNYSLARLVWIFLLNFDCSMSPGMSTVDFRLLLMHILFKYVKFLICVHPQGLPAVPGDI